MIPAWLEMTAADLTAVVTVAFERVEIGREKADIGNAVPASGAAALENDGASGDDPLLDLTDGQSQEVGDRRVEDVFVGG